MPRPINPYTGRRRKGWATVDEDADVLTLARERTRVAFDRFDHIVVSFSGGKDSTAVFNLAYDEAQARGQRLRVVFFDEEAIPYETEDYVRRVAALPGVDMEWYCVPVKHRNACSREHPWWYPWAPEDRHLWVRPMPPEAITTIPGYPNDEPSKRLIIPDLNGLLHPVSLGNVGLLMGIRADESVNRRRSITHHLHDPWMVHYTAGATEKGNVWKVYPIYDWVTSDVWLAPATLGWDHNRAYDAMELSGIPHKAQRCAPPYGEEPLRNLDMYAVCFPDIWDAMTARVPGAAAGARYSRTELWSFGSQPQKPVGMPWTEFITHYVDRQPADYRAKVAKRIGGFMRRHYHRTSEPLAERAPHPATGVSWGFLLNIAIRGDFKSRRETAAGLAADPEKARREYDADIARIRAEGREEEIRP
ncbi:MAG: phosphoadenosine phosphosulfate reductase family protein [Chloroflexi bacterium]|jgi:predicted phosphoadenosine phosphosulfate sulfurtransferase|nr:phosphoadenosine phosphosulfate reductase family protein [Chloroflexota bacterium]